MAASEQRQGLTLVVADDHGGVRAMYARLLRLVPGIGAVVEAQDGAEAIRAAVAHAADIVVLDLHMPEVDGADAAAALLELEPVPCVILHSSDPDGLAARAGDLGVPLFDKLAFGDLLECVARVAGPAASVA